MAVTRISTSTYGWDEVGTEINRSYGDFRFGSTRTLPSFHQRGLADDTVIVARADLLSSIRGAIATYEAPTVLSILEGHIELRSSGGTIISPERGAFFIRGRGLSFRLEGDEPRSVVVQLSSDALREAARHVSGQEPALPDDLPAVVPHLAQEWNRAVSELKRVYESDELYASYLIKSAAQRELHEAAVAAFGLVRHLDYRSPSSRTVAAARRYIDEHIDSPLTVGVIADATHVSVRGLQAAFEREGADTPMRYAKRARLAAVHHDLALADPDTQTVRDIARRWGFVSLGRFAADYFAAFEVMPRQTLAA